MSCTGLTGERVTEELEMKGITEVRSLCSRGPVQISRAPCGCGIPVNQKLHLPALHLSLYMKLCLSVVMLCLYLSHMHSYGL